MILMRVIRVGSLWLDFDHLSLLWKPCLQSPVTRNFTRLQRLLKKMDDKIRDISFAMSFKKRAGMESGPVALMMLIFSRSLHTPLTEISMCLALGNKDSPIDGKSDRLSEVKTEMNFMFKIKADTFVVWDDLLVCVGCVWFFFFTPNSQNPA